MFCRARTYCKCKFHIIKWTDISSIISYLAFQCVFVKLPFLAEVHSLLLLVSFSKSFNLFAFVSNATFISHFLLEENLCFSSFFRYILFLLKVYGILSSNNDPFPPILWSLTKDFLKFSQTSSYDFSFATLIRICLSAKKRRISFIALRSISLYPKFMETMLLLVLLACWTPSSLCMRFFLMFIFVIDFDAQIASNRGIVEASVKPRNSKSRSLSFDLLVPDKTNTELFENNRVYLAGVDVNFLHRAVPVHCCSWCIHSSPCFCVLGEIRVFYYIVVQNGNSNFINELACEVFAW